ncbi:MAG: helix-turn-helix transcriptional regulator, partial [Lachnospiraceae bacterium]|nr:helix-turn-helix transcriptional regulator [Lachnospiraceae bacterium]
KVLLLLETKAMTQAQVSEILKIKKQNINKYVSDLKKMGLLEVDRIEGRNQFLRATNSFLPQENQDQMTFDDI